MEKFTASNGVVLSEDEKGMTFSTTDWAKVRTAMTEFFLHERDQELGRWRWPENPDYLVYPKSKSAARPDPGVRVLHESTGRSREVDRGWADQSRFGEAARAFFAAHSEPKPWHDAKPGEVWAAKLTAGSGAGEVVLQVMDFFSEGIIFMDWAEEAQYELTDSEVKEARRVWPEVSDVSE